MPKPIRRVYVAGPFTNNDPHKVAENINAASEMAEILRGAGFFPYVPHSALGGARAVAVDFVGQASEVFIGLPDLSWDEAMEDCRDMVARMDAVFLLPDWAKSRGATEEKALAEALGLPVFTTLEALEAAAIERVA